MAERRAPATPYPLTADLAGVLAMAQQERTESLWRLFVLLFRAARPSDHAVTDAPLDTATAVR